MIRENDGPKDTSYELSDRYGKFFTWPSDLALCLFVRKNFNDEVNNLWFQGVDKYKNILSKVEFLISIIDEVEDKNKITNWGENGTSTSAN